MLSVSDSSHMLNRKCLMFLSEHSVTTVGLQSAVSPQGLRDKREMERELSALQRKFQGGVFGLGKSLGLA